MAYLETLPNPLWWEEAPGIPSPRGSFLAVFSEGWMKPEVAYTCMWLSPFRLIFCG